jgi:integrase
MASKDGKSLRVRLRIKGKLVSQNFPVGTSRDLIKRYESELRLERINKDLVNNCPTFKAWAEIWLKYYAQLHKTPSSVIKDLGTLKNHLYPAFGGIKLSDIEPQDIVNLQTKLWNEGEGYAAQSINNVVSLCSAILKNAVMHRKINFNPCSSIKRISRRERTPTFWTFEETDRFLRYCKDQDYELFQLCAFALNTGLRPGELQGLLRDCLDFDLGYVTVRRNWCTKTNRLNEYTKTKTDRKVSVSPAIMRILVEKRHLDTTASVFSMDFNTLGFRRLRPLAIAAGVTPIRFHDLRHTFASHLIMRGKHVVEVKELLGHTKLDTTMKYMHLAEDRKKGVTDCLTQGMSWLDENTGNVVALHGRN